MISISNVEVLGWEHSVRGMRNPMNSWGNSDTKFYYDDFGVAIEIGEKDYDLMKRLVASGSDHRKFMRMIVVYLDVNAPIYWWKEADTYVAGVTKNSCSTMHKIHAKEFTREDFSWEHLYSPYDEEDLGSEELSEYILLALNRYRERYLETKDKRDWLQMIQLLPSSYNQRRTVMLNYEVLRNMYHARKNHKLYEWREFCKWIETLPYSKLITDKGV